MLCFGNSFCNDFFTRSSAGRNLNNCFRFGCWWMLMSIVIMNIAILYAIILILKIGYANWIPLCYYSGIIYFAEKKTFFNSTLLNGFYGIMPIKSNTVRAIDIIFFIKIYLSFFYLANSSIPTLIASQNKKVRQPKLSAPKNTQLQLSPNIKLSQQKHENSEPVFLPMKIKIQLSLRVY